MDRSQLIIGFRKIWSYTNPARKNPQCFGSNAALFLNDGAGSILRLYVYICHTRINCMSLHMFASDFHMARVVESFHNQVPNFDPITPGPDMGRRVLGANRGSWTLWAATGEDAGSAVISNLLDPPPEPPHISASWHNILGFLLVLGLKMYTSGYLLAPPKIHKH